MKELLEESGARLNGLVQGNAYPDANGWRFVALVVSFIVAFLVGGYFELPLHHVEWLAGAVIGHQFARTYRR